MQLKMFESLGESDTIKLLELNDREMTFWKHYFCTDCPFTVLIDQLEQRIINSISAHAYVK